MNFPSPVWKALVIGFLVLLLAGISFAIAIRPTRPSSRLGMRGLKRQRSVVESPTWAIFEPLVRWTGVRVSAVLSETARARYDVRLTHAGDVLGLTPEEYVACMILTGICGAVFGTGMSLLFSEKFGWAPLPLFTIVGAMIPYALIDSVFLGRMKSISRGLPYAIDLMALAMGAGLDFPGSVEQVVQKSKTNEALREELAYLLHQLQLGRTRAQALRELMDRVPLDSVREFVLALTQAEERGNPVAAVLQVQAVTARTRRTNQAEKAAQDMRANLVIPIAMFVGIGMVVTMLPASMMADTLLTGPQPGVRR
jgi:tight adherence protein C